MPSFPPPYRVNTQHSFKQYIQSTLLFLSVYPVVNYIRSITNNDNNSHCLLLLLLLPLIPLLITALSCSLFLTPVITLTADT